MAPYFTDIADKEYKDWCKSDKKVLKKLMI